MSWRDSNRRTGRSTRMLQAALEQARQGRAVYVVAATEAHVTQLMEQLHELCPGWRQLGIKVESYLDLGTQLHLCPTPMLRGAHPNCRVLVDHYAIEHYFGHIVDLFHRYDEVI